MISENSGEQLAKLHHFAKILTKKGLGATSASKVDYPLYHLKTMFNYVLNHSLSRFKLHLIYEMMR